MIDVTLITVLALDHIGKSIQGASISHGSFRQLPALLQASFSSHVKHVSSQFQTYSR